VGSNPTSSANNMKTKINFGSGSKYDPEYLNIDIDPSWNPDVVCDLSKEIPHDLWPGCYDEIKAIHVLEHIKDLVPLMHNLLTLLKVDGILKIEVPYDLSHGAWQDPTHVRAFNECSWKYYCDWHWYLGWKDYRFKEGLPYFVFSNLGMRMHAEGKPLDEIIRTPRAIDAMKVELTKIII
jgi:hypothetical protein